MNRLGIRGIDVLYAVALIAADLLVYAFIVLMLMHYDDNYEQSKGSYGSWDGMTTFDRWACTAIFLWNLVNIAVALFFGRRLFKKLFPKRA